MKNIIFVISLVLLMTGCASNVKLAEVPVEDKAGAAVSTDNALQPKSSVTTVEVSKLPGMDPGPVGVGKLVMFDYDSFVIKPEYQSLIESHAKYLRADAKRKVNLVGHTDERGGREYNLALGQKRSESVRKALALLGVSDSQLEAVSFGKEKPVDTATNEDAYAKNRRAEISYR